MIPALLLIPISALCGWMLWSRLPGSAEEEDALEWFFGLVLVAVWILGMSALLLAEAGLPVPPTTSALALSAQRSSEAVDPLVRAIRDDEGAGWQLFAQCLGHYGGGSFRAITRSMEDYGLAGERASHVVAQLSLHGARSQVNSLARRGEETEQEAAKRALDLANQFKQQPADAQGLEGVGDLAVFSGIFQARYRGDAV